MPMAIETKELWPHEAQTLARKVGGRMRAKRKASGMTLKDLADICKTTPQTIQRLEVGSMTLSVVWIAKIAAALGADPADFFLDNIDISGRKAQALRMIKEANEDFVAEVEQARLALNANIYSQLAILGEKE